ncbi:hypothetical protein [Magnetococcus marinus]|nr:hypothetical protein [Magnetococcus marinus]
MMPKTMDSATLQASCIAQISPLLEGVRQAHEGKIPQELLNNHYLLGYLWGMLSVSISRAHMEDEASRGRIMINVTAQLLQQEPQMIAVKLANLHQADDDLDYFEGISDGSDRLSAPHEGRREEVIYRLIHRLEPYC